MQKGPGVNLGPGPQGPWPWGSAQSAQRELQCIIINSNVLQCIAMSQACFNPDLTRFDPSLLFLLPLLDSMDPSTTELLVYIGLHDWAMIKIQTKMQTTHALAVTIQYNDKAHPVQYQCQ
jgi:hypothetical protein